MSFLVNSGSTPQSYLNSLHMASQNYVLKTVALSDTLVNTNLGLENTRATGVESAIDSHLTSYIASNNASLASMSSTLTAIQSTLAYDEGVTAAESTRASTAEALLQSHLDTANATTVAETTRATAAEVVLTSGISDIKVAITAIQEADQFLTDQLSALRSYHAGLVSTVATLRSDTDAEIARATSAEQTESSRAENAESSIQSSLGSEVTRATGVEASISGSVAAEVTRASNVESSLQSAITLSAAAIQAIQVVDSVQTSQINSTAAQVSSLLSTLSTVQASQSTDEASITDIQSKMTALASTEMDVTLMSYWSNAYDNINAEIRLVRKGDMVTVVMSNFLASTINDNVIAQYNLSVPSWAIPTVPVNCAVVVSTNNSRSIGCAAMDSNGLISIFPFSGSWAGFGGLCQPTSFSYLLGNGAGN